MQHLAIFLTIVLFSFPGCSNKTTPEPSDRQLNTPITNTSPSVDTQDSKQEADDNKQEFEEEFETEFEADETNNSSDLLSGYNRSMTTFNDKVIMYALNPVSEAYAYCDPSALTYRFIQFYSKPQLSCTFSQ